MRSLFPAGEKFFIDSVRAVRYHPAIKDNEELQKEISAFMLEYLIRFGEWHSIKDARHRFTYT